ncbi:MAG: hypothetical protein KDD35_01935 [Bdellovibrionales bacterium]|nr:hypothetical protein [Bdellovibrionales bacterium]
MNKPKKRSLVICPGRGSYTKESLGYLNSHRARMKDFIDDIDNRRQAEGLPTISELDSAASFSPALHTKGEHASPLIYSCAYTDFKSIDLNEVEILAIAGNSMGWYLTLAFGGALDLAGAYQLIGTMGSMMKNQLIGGQIIYPLVRENWQQDQEKQDLLFRLISEGNQIPGNQIYPSIYLGGYLVLGGNKGGLDFLLKNLPPVEHFPFQLINHGAFHTPLLTEISEQALTIISQDIFQKPNIPLIDGRGHIWKSYSTDVRLLYEYTLEHQVVETYDFTKSIEVGLKEYNPDQLILLGPGNSLGGAIGQILVKLKWQGITTKQDFVERQKRDPILLSMGLKL